MPVNRHAQWHTLPVMRLRLMGFMGLMVPMLGLVIGWAACTGSERRAAAPAAGDESLAALRYRVATDPTDVPARVALARLELAAGRPGAAFEHLAFVHRGRALEQPEQILLARLHAQRFAERLAARDGAAHVDAEAALALQAEAGIDASIGANSELAPRMRAEGYFLAALAALRRGNRWGREQAVGFLAQAARLAPGDPRLVLGAGPGQARLEDLGQTALWLHRGRARREALELLEVYARRGGRERAVLEALVVETAWWRGARTQPDPALVQQLGAAGVSLCLLARTPADLGCGESLWALAEAGGPMARAVWRRAEQLFWRTDDPRQAAAWALLAIRAWSEAWHDDPDLPWIELVRRRLDVARLAGSPAVPAHAAAVLWRAAGQPEQAAMALARALEPVLAQADASAGQGQAALLVAEAAAQALPAERIDVLRARLPAGYTGWYSALVHARGLGDTRRLAALLAEQPGAAAAYLHRSGAAGPLAWGTGARSHALAWWWLVLGQQRELRAGRAAVWQAWQAMWPQPPDWRLPAGVAAGVPAAALVTPDDSPTWQTPAANVPAADDDAAVALALAELARAYRREPAVADRLARDLVQRAASAGRHGPAVAALFAALGDPGRALAWWERIAAESPEHPDYLLAVGMAAARAGDLVRAHVHFTRAAARSGDAGSTSLHIATFLLRQGLALDAISQGRQALALIAPGERGPVLAVLATAMADLGRTRDAEAMREAWVAEVPQAFRDHARQALAPPRPAPEAIPSSTGEPAPETTGDSPRSAAHEHMPDPAAALAAAAQQPDPAAAQRILETALAWHPGHVGLHAALLTRLEPRSEAYGRAAASLLGVAVTAPPESARAALEVLEHALARMGARTEVRWVRTARRALLPAFLSAPGPLVPALASP